MGARGNSGVIFSQMVRGFAEVVADRRAARRSNARASIPRRQRHRVRAVTKPVEGTMLTVIREMAEEAEAHADGTPRELLAAVVRRGADAVERTPELLDVLRSAGVVDAGGAGLLEIVRGIAAALAGEPIPEAPPEEELNVEAVHQELSEFRYCTVFVVEGDGTRPRGAAGEARGARRLAARGRRRDGGEGARAHGRSRRGARARDRAPARSSRSRSRTCTSRRSSARSGCFRSCPTLRLRSARSSPSSRAPATARCSRAPARGRSSRAASR